MQTVKMSELRPGSYINHNGEIIGKEQAEKIIISGQTPELYTVSDEWIQECLLDAYQERMEGRPKSESYCAPDPHSKRILY